MHPLADLVVNDARRDWILSVYPPEDTGRPGILATELKKQAEKPRRDPARLGLVSSPETELELEDEAEARAVAA
jgi:hypothetical protein